MKLLFLIDNPCKRKWLMREFAKHQSTLSYTMDVVCTGCTILSKDDTDRLNLNIQGCPTLSMSSREAPGGFYLMSLHNKTGLQALRQNNDYSYLVNACDPNEAGELNFDYTRERYDLLSCPTLKFNISALLCNLQAEEAFEEAFKQIEAQLQKS